MALFALTIGAPTPTGWVAVTDRGERVEVPLTAAADWRPAMGQRVVATTDAADVIVSISVGGTSVGLPISRRS